MEMVDVALQSFFPCQCAPIDMKPNRNCCSVHLLKSGALVMKNMYVRKKRGKFREAQNRKKEVSVPSVKLVIV
jgi:hypothetical protein